MSESDRLHAEADRYRAESNRLRMVAGRTRLPEAEQERLTKDAEERYRSLPRASLSSAALSPMIDDRPRPYMVPGEHVALRADAMLGLLADLADAKFRAAYLEAMQTRRWEDGNARLERTISDLRHENNLLAAKAILLMGHLTDRKRKAKATEAQRRKAGDRRRRNAR